MPFRFNSLLEEAGISAADVRLLRHQPKVGDKFLLDVWRTDRAVFEDYQAVQLISKRTSFARQFWACFIGTWDGRTVFAGLYSINGCEPLQEPWVDPVSGILQSPGLLDRYTITRTEVLDAYEGRLYIDWGGGSSGKRAWVQRAEAQNKVIAELHLDSRDQPFPGLMSLVAPLSSLAAMPPTWIERLVAAKGVYLLTCPRDGSLYVGSATAEGGFWSRWETYRANGHGGNVALIGREPSDFVVSVLQVAGSTETADDILAAEQVWKMKLQSRALGLNRN